MGSDSLGLTFEMFDNFGRFRTEELRNTADARGEVALDGDREIQGPVTNAH